MGKITGFLEIDRQDRKYAPAADRVRNYNEFVIPLGDEGTKKQAARCMNCGIPYCHNGCPVNNQIPDWNDLVYNDHWEEASRNLHSTNNFPEFTGRVCPAPCEASCTLNLEDNARHHQDDRMRDCRQGLGKWLDQADHRCRKDRQESCRRRRLAHRALRPHSNWRVPATMFICLKRTPRPAA